MSGGSVEKYQYLAAICVNIITVSFGAFIGWPSASLLELQSDVSPLPTGPVTNDEAGWMCAAMPIGGTLGTILFSWSAEKFGRKRTLLLMAVPSLIGWLMIPFAQSPMHFYVSRFIGGLSGGGAFIVIPIYVAELAEDSVRGSLGTLLVLGCNLGVMLSFILGYFYTYDICAWILSSLTVLFLGTFAFLPDTPSYLLKNNKFQEAEKALRYFRNVRGGVQVELPEQFQQELEKLKGDEVPHKDEQPTLTWQDFNDRPARKAMFIGFTLMALMQFTGCYAMMNYSASIFQQSGSNLSPKLSSIIVGVIQLVGSYMPTVLIERAGRKLLLLLSSVGLGIGQFALATYVYLSAQGYDVQPYSWVPIASFSFIIFIAYCGLLSVPYVVLSEIFHPKIRDASIMACLLVSWLFGFVLLKFFPIMSEMVGMQGMCFIFGICCIVGAAFVLIFLPETKGKSIETILKML